LAHLLGVCAIVLENGGDEIEACAALLHDVAEDHGGYAALAEVERRCGLEVSAIVEACSDSFTAEGAAKAPWLGRKQQYIERLEHHARSTEGQSILLVSAADKLYNFRSIRDDRLRAQPDGDSVYQRFNAKKWGTLWYYRTLADVYERVPGRHRFISRELGALVDELSEALGTDELLRRYRSEIAAPVAP
jgi:(p)ppGpp synthase/HD superfamily hydrolase